MKIKIFLMAHLAIGLIGLKSNAAEQEDLSKLPMLVVKGEASCNWYRTSITSTGFTSISCSKGEIHEYVYTGGTQKVHTHIPKDDNDICMGTVSCYFGEVSFNDKSLQAATTKKGYAFADNQSIHLDDIPIACKSSESKGCEPLECAKNNLLVKTYHHDPKYEEQLNSYPIKKEGAQK